MRKAIGIALLGTMLTAAIGVTGLVGESPDSSKTASRYYLRNRSNDFYGRAKCAQVDVADSIPAADPSVGEGEVNQIAARYYLRNRTRNFYRRSTHQKRRVIG
jgi:hypothetical protein